MGLVDKVKKAKKAVSLEKSERESFLSEVRHLAEQRLRGVAGEEDFTLSSRIYTGISGYHYDCKYALS